MNNDFTIKEFGYETINISLDVNLLIDSSVNEDDTMEIVNKHKDLINNCVGYETREFNFKCDDYNISGGYDDFNLDDEEVTVYVSIEHYFGGKYDNRDNPTSEPCEGQEEMKL